MIRRIILKLSGEALQGEQGFGIDHAKLARIAKEIATIKKLNVQIGLVVGGGNIIRGSQLGSNGFDRICADQMGMLATLINGLALREALMRESVTVSLLSALSVPGLIELYDRSRALELIEQQVLVLVGGTGNPLVTTDSAAALRGIELNVDLIIKATKVDGVFAEDPIKNAHAKHYTQLTYDDVLQQQLGVMDLNAILLCKAHSLPLRVCNMSQSGALQQIIQGEAVGTLITEK